MSLTIDPYGHRARLLTFSLHQLQREAARFASAATIHALTNIIATVRIALHLVAARVDQGKDTEIEALLELAETSLCQGRVLLARTRQARFSGRRSATLAVAA